MDYEFLYPQGGGEKQSNNKAINAGHYLKRIILL